MRYSRLVAHAAAFALLALKLPILSAQDGAAIYKERCASCHNEPEGRVPSLSAIKEMSGEAIYVGLSPWLRQTNKRLCTGRW